MSQQYLPFTLTAGAFYDVPWHEGSPLVAEEFPQPRLPASWRSWTSGPWRVAAPPGTHLPQQGWKVHVAALPVDAAETVERASAVCRDLGVAHKMLRSRQLVHATQLKYADARSSGKVVVCYPSAEGLEQLCNALACALPVRAAPDIVGELQVPGTRLWLRHGAFLPQWGWDAAGRAVPMKRLGDVLVRDDRGRCDDASPAPAFVHQLRRAHHVAATPTLDVTDVRLLHRSNAGGVFRARWSDGTAVVMKEARDHAGLDIAGVDAGVRLRHEWEALQRLVGTGIAPEPVALVRLQSSMFLVMSDVAAPNLVAVMSRRHPVFNPAADDPAAGRPAAETGGNGACVERTEPAPGYYAWRHRIARQLEEVVQVLEDRGMVHGDLQPGNVLDTGDRLVLIDFESAQIDGRSAASGVAAPGFGYETGRGSDRPAVGVLQRLLIDPTLTPVLSHRPELADRVCGAAAAALHAADSTEPDLLGHEPHPPTSSVPTRAELVAGIWSFATPGRADRLFPGDIAQFSGEWEALGLRHGAVGVLAALDAVGEPIDPLWIDWVEERALAASSPIRGLAGGCDGVALHLARWGRGEAAERVLARAADAPVSPSLGLLSGQLGVAVAGLDLGRLLGRDDLVANAVQRLQAVGTAVTRSSASQATAAIGPVGLEAGWSGVGLGLLASRGAEGVDPAATCLTRDVARCRRVGPRLMSTDTGTLLPYLSRGSAAVGLLAAELLAHRPDHRDAADWRALVAAVGHMADCPSVYQAGLFDGRAGLLVTLRALQPEHPGVAGHRERLGWFTVKPTLGGRRTAVLLGEHNLRGSLDLATGSAGALLALYADQPWDALAHVFAVRATRRPEASITMRQSCTAGTC